MKNKIKKGKRNFMNLNSYKVLPYYIFNVIILFFSVLISIRLSEMKVVYYYGVNWVENPLFLSEYSLTLGLLSIMIFYLGVKLLDILWGKIK